MDWLPMDSGSNYEELPVYFIPLYHLDQWILAGLYSSYKFEPILSISMCAIGRLGSITSPSETLCY